MFRFLTGKKDLSFQPSIQMDPEAHPVSYSVGNGSSCSGVTGWSMKLTNHLQPVPRLWMSDSTRILLPYAFMVGTFKFCLRLDKLLISLINLALFSFSSNESFLMVQSFSYFYTGDDQRTFLFFPLTTVSRVLVKCSQKEVPFRIKTFLYLQSIYGTLSLNFLKPVPVH